MTKQKVGLLLFWIGGIWAILWGVIGGISASSVMHSLTPSELNQSIWALDGPVFLLYGFSPALGGFVAGIGALLYTSVKGSTVWKFGIGIFIVFVIAMVLTQLRYLPPLFGVGGTLILLFFFGILWLWAKERMALKGSSTVAADFKLIGYVFMLMAAWFTCGIGSQPFFESLEGLDPMNPIHIMIFLVLGWLFLFLSHYKLRKQQG
ncbi:hypothetical protein ACFLV5_03020 [Chloroflexota bacterium]